MTNKLVFVINRLKYQKLRKFLPYEMKLQLPPESLTRGLPPPYPRSLCPLSSTEFVEHPPPPQKNSWVRHWSKVNVHQYVQDSVCLPPSKLFKFGVEVETNYFVLHWSHLSAWFETVSLRVTFVGSSCFVYGTRDLKKFRFSSFSCSCLINHSSFLFSKLITSSW